MDVAALHEILEQAKQIKAHALVGGNTAGVLWELLHPLAEAQYLPAFDYFVAGLDDAEWDWRDYCLSLLGFHYPILANGEVLSKIRRLLVQDASDMVRLTAAAVLGSRSQWPEPALQTALQTDPDADVRAVAFGALLDLARVPREQKRQAEDRIKAGDLQPTWEEVQRVLAEAGVDPAAQQSQ